MPIVYTHAQIFCHVVEILLGLELTGSAFANGREAHDATKWFILWHSSTTRGMAQILRIWGPIAFGHFDGNQASQRLLLSRATERGKFAPDRDSGSGDGILGWSGTRAQIRLHGLDVVVMAAAIGGLLRAVGIIGSGFDDTVIAGMLGMLGTGDGGHPLDSFAMTGCIAALATVKGIATFPGVVGISWIVGIGRIGRMSCMSCMSCMTTGITAEAATAGRLVPGSRCGQTTAGSGCITGDGADNVAKFFCLLSVTCQAVIPGVAHTDI